MGSRRNRWMAYDSTRFKRNQLNVGESKADCYGLPSVSQTMKAKAESHCTVAARRHYLLTGADPTSR